MLHGNPLFRRLEPAKHVLVAGAGGGFDIMSALPIGLTLSALGKKVFYANLSFTHLGATDAPQRTRGLYEVTATSAGDLRYFPERHLASWLAARGEPASVFAFEKMGVAPTREAYAWLGRVLDIDAIVLVDGGTDILMHGDEAGLGTPAEDVTSLLSAHALDVPTKILACVGFGVDAFHGVCHAHFLENAAALAKAGAYFGAFSLTTDVPEVVAWLEAMEYVQERTPGRESIVCASIGAATRGEFGNHHTIERTRASGTELFVNPLMSLVWTFDLDAVAKRCLYASGLTQTQSMFEVSAIIEGFRKGRATRPRRAIPA
jgi:hypothetical protein